MPAVFENPIFTDKAEARRHLEKQRWANGRFCPHCGEADEANLPSMKGGRDGLFQCKSCRKQFTVTVGTVFERSKVPLNKWLYATHLMTSSKKGVSAHQIHRAIGVTYKTAWFMCHRIREAMKSDVSSHGPIGGEGKTVEADETYIGKRDTTYVSPHRKGRPYTKGGKSGGAQKRTVVSLVERGGNVRSFHVKSATKAGVRDILVRNVPRSTTLYTDESRLYTTTGREFVSHETVNHSAKEYARGLVHTNTIEGFFSIFKRGMKGIYQHCGEAHLHRYLSEYDFRYNNRIHLGVDDTARFNIALKGIEGKRLTYRRTDEAGYA